MPRRKSVNFKRDIGVDSRFKSPLVQKFINVTMERGKKNIAQAIIYGAFDEFIRKANVGSDAKACALFEKIIAQVRPAVEVKSRRVGGGVYQVPVEVKYDRANALAIRWTLSAARVRKDKTMSKRLAAEWLDILDGRGNAIKAKLEKQKLAEVNRVFAQYAW